MSKNGLMCNEQWHSFLFVQRNFMTITVPWVRCPKHYERGFIVILIAVSQRRSLLETFAVTLPNVLLNCFKIDVRGELPQGVIYRVNFLQNFIFNQIGLCPENLEALLRISFALRF